MSPAAAPGTVLSSAVAGPGSRCGCRHCQQLRRRYKKAWRIARERGAGPRLVEAAPVLQQLRELLAAGWTRPQLAYATGLTGDYLPMLLGERDGAAPAKVRAATADAILALTSADRYGPRQPERTLVDPTGTIRRLRALAAVGHPVAQLLRDLGCNSSLIQMPTISVRNARRVSDAYDRLWNVPGPSPKAAAYARTHGWAPPEAWDDEHIDDPRAIPIGVRPATETAGPNRSAATRAYLAGEARFLTRAGVTVEQVAVRLGISRDYAKTLIDTSA